MKTKTTSAKLERFFRAIASKRRIDILIFLKNNKDVSVKELAEQFQVSEQNMSLHSFKLVNAGLITKKQEFNKVVHKLTGRGEKVLKWIEEIDKKL